MKSLSYSNTRYLSKSKKIATIENSVFYVVSVFPITTLLSTALPFVNTILAIIVFALMFSYFLFKKEKHFSFLLVFYAIAMVFSKYVLSNGVFYNRNLIVYFPFFILYFLFCFENVEKMSYFIKSNIKFLKITCYCWCFLVFISLIFPSSYIYESGSFGFVSFAGSSFRLCPAAIFAFAQLLLVYRFTHDEKILLLFIAPSISILFGVTRTYLVLLVILMLFLLRLLCKTSTHFKLLLIPTMLIIGLVIVISPISNKFVNAITNVNTDFGVMFSLTSGRSLFWEADIRGIFQQDLSHIFFGNDLNFIYEINHSILGNYIWAHNDFIQILSDYGIIGTIIYVLLILKTSTRFIDHQRHIAFFFILTVFLWLMNASFNMFYTYFCAMLSFPFILQSVKFINGVNYVTNN